MLYTMADGKRLAALSYVARGWAVIPLYEVLPDGQCACGQGVGCKTPAKHPRLKQWQNGWTHRPAQIETWWEHWPEANIGIATGSPSGFWALDIDPKHAGDQALAGLILMHSDQPWPRTYTVRTGSGGTHYYWPLPPGQAVTNSRGRLPVGIDVRGDGGYVVAAGSVSTFGPYTVLDDPGFPWRSA